MSDFSSVGFYRSTIVTAVAAVLLGALMLAPPTYASDTQNLWQSLQSGGHVVPGRPSAVRPHRHTVSGQWHPISTGLFQPMVPLSGNRTGPVLGGGAGNDGAEFLLSEQGDAGASNPGFARMAARGTADPADGSGDASGKHHRPDRPLSAIGRVDISAR